LLNLFKKQTDTKPPEEQAVQGLIAQEQTDLTSTPAVVPDAAQTEPVQKKNT